MALTKCDSLSFFSDYSQIIRELGKKWRNDSKNPANDPLFLNSANIWDAFIRKWASDSSMPLLIRKKDFEYGTINIHKSGRKLIPVDNSPAQWVFVCVCNGISPPVNVIAEINNGVIPIAMVLKTEHVSIAYRGRLRNCLNVNELGWKLAHKKAIGLKKKMFDCTLKELEEHFINFMSPLNMFVFPKAMMGLAELSDFIEQQQ